MDFHNVKPWARHIMARQLLKIHLMMTLLVLSVTILLASLIWIAVEFRNAPLGYEDQDGFHAIRQNKETATPLVSRIWIADPKLARQPATRNQRRVA
jgi:hypothetical protein